MISDVVHAVNHAIVSNNMSTDAIARSLGRARASYSGTTDKLATVVRTLRVDGVFVRAFRYVPESQERITSDVKRLYRELVSVLHETTGARPVSFRLVDHIGYAASSEGDTYTLCLAVDYLV